MCELSAITAAIEALAVPSKLAEPVTSPVSSIVLEVASLVAVEAFPVKAPVTSPVKLAVIVPALNPPEASLFTIIFAVERFVASETSDESIDAAVVDIVILPVPSKDVAVPVTFPEIPIVLAVVSFAALEAVEAFPDNVAVRVEPDTVTPDESNLLSVLFQNGIAFVAELTFTPAIDKV